MHRIALLLVLLPLLSGCAERWSRPGTSEETADAMNAACGNEAQLAVPPQMVWQMVEPPRIERDRQCWRDGNRERCRVTERFRPARYDMVDLAISAREQHRTACMREKGFTFEGYRPLRLN
jgi:endonuclease I